MFEPSDTPLNKKHVRTAVERSSAILRDLPQEITESMTQEELMNKLVEYYLEAQIKHEMRWIISSCLYSHLRLKYPHLKDLPEVVKILLRDKTLNPNIRLERANAIISSSLTKAGN